MWLRSATLDDLLGFPVRDNILSGWAAAWTGPAAEDLWWLMRPVLLESDHRPLAVLATSAMPFDGWMRPWVSIALAEKYPGYEREVLPGWRLVRGWLDYRARGHYTKPEEATPEYIRPLRLMGFTQVKEDLWRWPS